MHTLLRRQKTKLSIDLIVERIVSFSISTIEKTEIYWCYSNIFSAFIYDCTFTSRTAGQLPVNVFTISQNCFNMHVRSYMDSWHYRFIISIRWLSSIAKVQLFFPGKEYKFKGDSVIVFQIYLIRLKSLRKLL